MTANNIPANVKKNIFSENIYPDWEIDEKFFIDIAKKILKFYLNQPEVTENCCLNGFDFDTVSFDFLYCDSVKTHEINREYRNKDYPADIITFAIFADSDEKFIFDGEINLGEVIIALDKVIEEAEKKGVTKEYELSFLISHGILHLLGFDHQTEDDYNFIMELQNKALGFVYDKI
ncbi:TPA: rRNA maturation RNase YbeY [Candidatus Gastranaerophilales bacterium HUM_20]|nr:probable rRNA maturation factor [Clostridium sp. CAG:729]DAB22457.1 MAG TPA: rRNA maturation RNase YbeY [Candidatus Gastranaerophilales bacterium HUM_20]